MQVAIGLGFLSAVRWFLSTESIFSLFVVLAFVGWWVFLLYFASWGRAWAFAAAAALALLELAIFVAGAVVSIRAGAGAGELLAQVVFMSVDAAIFWLGLKALRQAWRAAPAAALAALVLAGGAVAAAEAATPRILYDVRPRALGRDVGSLALSNPARTVDVLEKEAAQNPQGPEPLLELARILVERAAEVETIQTIPYYYRNTGEVAGQLKGDDPLQRAAGYLERALRLRAECPDCELLRARLLLARGRHAEVRDGLQRWMLRNGERPEALVLLAVALEAQGDRFTAEGLARKALFQEPGMAEAHLVVGRALLERKAPAEAREAFERAQRAAAPWQQRPRLEATLGLSRALQEEGQVPRAEEVLREGLRQAPDEAAYYDELSKLLVAARRHADVVQLNLDRLRARKYDPEAYAHLYEAFEQIGDWQGAERLFASMVERDGEDATAQYCLGLVRRNLHKAEAARRAFQRAMELAGEGSQVHRLARRQLSR